MKNNSHKNTSREDDLLFDVVARLTRYLPNLCLDENCGGRKGIVLRCTHLNRIWFSASPIVVHAK